MIGARRTWLVWAICAWRWFLIPLPGQRYASESIEARKSGSSRCGSGFVSSTVRQRNRRALWNGPIGVCAGRLLAEIANRFPGTGDSRESQEDFLVHGTISPLGKGEGTQTHRDPIHAPFSDRDAGLAIFHEWTPGASPPPPTPFLSPAPLLNPY